ncbi:site-specific integrase [Aquimarina sp. ERC-38]|uniref:site-specific integrase n=1 Tax=Aquimarina sp. ERC-38 TaxID=2949996 RepID=UPI0022464082|nr:site-specific integrase [Aquimarina sp. ERC-38]UZO81721.1 site-specific integrase [Aquimarina sp. ERC-38]UZO82118.1 site-specific integrase [Aquimarina sp. ERC-38]
MITTKILLYKSKKKADDTFPIVLRITYDRKPKYIFLAYIKEKDWNFKTLRVKNSHPQNQSINNLIINKLALAENLILESRRKNEHIDIKQIIRKIKLDRVGQQTFYELTETHLKELKQLKKYASYRNYVRSFNSFKKFNKNEDLYFEQITLALLKKLEIYLVAKNLGQDSLYNMFSFIRVMYNKAIRLNEVEQKHYPFGRGKFTLKTPNAEKIGLNIEEIKDLEELELPEDSSLNHTRNAFLFSFYLAGIRFSDVLTMRWDAIRDGRLYYAMRKNQKLDSLELPIKVIAILEKYELYKEDNKGLIFPFLRKCDFDNDEAIHRALHNHNTYVNKNLKKIAKLAKIEKKLTFHIARHSFGNISGSKIPVQMLQKLYRHSDIATTVRYQSNFDHTLTDKALNDVLNF